MGKIKGLNKEPWGMWTFRGQEEEDKDLAKKTEKKHWVRREKNQMVWSPESGESVSRRRNE